jgi:hypothetical protein
MQRQQSRSRRSLLGIAVACLMTTQGASAGFFTRGCAARDLQLTMLIDQQENSGAISAEESRTAMLSLLDARIVCYQGNVSDAISIYDNIAQSIARGPALTERLQPAETP